MEKAAVQKDRRFFSRGVHASPGIYPQVMRPALYWQMESIQESISPG